jgi:hypothetical protein
MPIDHLAVQFELFLALWVFEEIFPIETDVEMFTLLWPPITPGDHKLKKKIDSALYQEALM